MLKEAYGLPEASASGAAMALNGGIASSGSTCGALTGAALAVGLLAERDVPDHLDAKRAARLHVAATLRAFEAAFGASTCRQLTGLDLSTEAGHQAFLERGAWRTDCTRQIEFVVTQLLEPDLANPPAPAAARHDSRTFGEASPDDADSMAR